MKLKFWGTRGSIPVPGLYTIKYGGNTPCIQITTRENKIIILDAGTGLRELGKHLLIDKKQLELNILISHSHWDHIHGIPFFAPFFENDFKINIYSNAENGYNAEKIIDAQMQPDFFPVNKEVFRAKLNYYPLLSGNDYSIAGLKIQTLDVNHSKGTLSFKISDGEKSIVYMTDNEIKIGPSPDKINMDEIKNLNEELINFCYNCDYLIHDSMYSAESFNDKIGWGHSNNVSLTYFSILSNVKNLVLFHYDPDHRDEMVDKMYIETKQILSENKSSINCIASMEKMELEI